MTQAKGSSSQVLLDFETTYGADPVSPAGIVVPFAYPFDLGGEEPLKASEVHRNTRNPAQPYYDNHDVKGSPSVPVDVINFGYWLRLLLGAPSTTRPAAKTLNGGEPAVDVGTGVVGLPCDGHGLATGTPVQIAGTTNYNGHFVVLASSTTNQINITAAYIAETFGGNNKKLNNAAAVDRTGGVVGLPCTSHGYTTGTIIEVSGTDHYDGQYIVLAASTTHEIRITATYQAETFVGDEDVWAETATARSDIYTHVFKPADELESAVLDKGFLNIDSYFKYNGVKVSKLSLAVEGKGGDLLAKLDLMGSLETVSGAAYDDSPTEYSLVKFQKRQASIKEAEETVATIKTLTLDLDNGLDGDTFVVAGGGIRGGLNEGDCQPSGKLTAMFTDLDLYNKAVNGTESSLELILTSGLYSLSILVPELLYSRKSPSIVKGGVWLEADFVGYYDNSAQAAALMVTLVNTHTSYA